MRDPDIKRLFFGLELKGDWMPPPDGRILDISHRHCTLAFLGNQHLPTLLEKLQDFKIQTPREFLGQCDKLLFLPYKRPRVAAGHINWEDSSCLSLFRQLTAFLQTNQYNLPDKDFLPHVTLARAPFTVEKWNDNFVPFSVNAISIALYQSVGNLVYLPVWKIPFEFKS